MAKQLFLLLIICLPASLFAQKQVVRLESFSSLDVFGPFDVELIASDHNQVELDYKGIDSEDVVAGVSRNTLRLKLRNRHYVNDWNSDKKRNSQYIRVKVYYKDIDEIKAQAGAIVTSAGQLKSKNLVIESSMGAEVSMEVLTKNLYLKASMGALVSLKGQSENVEVKSSMGAVVKARQLQSRTAFVKASMGSEVYVCVTEKLEVSAGLGAVVDYTGSPAVRHSTSTFGAEVRGREQ